MKKTLSLGGQVRQTVGVGRTKVVQVEVRKKRIITPDQKPVLLSEDTSHKLKLVQEAQRVAEHTRQEEARRAKVEQERLEAEKKRLEEEERAHQEAAEKEAIAIQEVQKKPVSEVREAPKRKNEKEEASSDRKNAARHDQEERPRKGDFEEKRGGKLNLNAFRNTFVGSDDDDDDNDNPGARGHRRSLASIRRAQEKERLKHIEASRPQEKIVRFHLKFALRPRGVLALIPIPPNTYSAQYGDCLDA